MLQFKINKYVFLVLLAGLLQGCFTETVIKERKPLTVTTYEVQKVIKTQIRNFKGTVVAADHTPLSFRIEGKLDSILVRNGEHVKKGQLLAKLVDKKLRQQLIDAQAQYDLSIKQHSRAQDLIAKKMVSQSELDELATNKEMAEVNFIVAKNKLKYTQLVAPFSGYISDIPKQSFESASPGEVILSLYRDDVVRVRINISNNVLAGLNPDTNERTYRVQSTFFGDENTHTLDYYKHTSEPMEGGKAFAFWLEMPQVEPPILPGTSANLKVNLLEAGLSTVNGYVIPMTALDAGTKTGEFYIWKLIDGVAHKQPVNITRLIREGAIISSGLSKGDLLINSNLRRLRDNTAVIEKESI